MRTTLNLDADLLRDAIKTTGVQQKTKLIHMGLNALIREQSLARLARLHGYYKQAKAGPRRRP